MFPRIADSSCVLIFISHKSGFLVFPRTVDYECVKIYLLSKIVDVSVSENSRFFVCPNIY